MREHTIAIRNLKQRITVRMASTKELHRKLSELRKRGPETGPERDQLWVDHVQSRVWARCDHLAYGLLRGRSLAQMEKVRRSEPYAAGVARAIAGADEALAARWTPLYVSRCLWPKDSAAAVLGQLDELLAKGEGDSAKADELRDEIDQLMRLMTPEERAGFESFAQEEQAA